MSSRVCRLHRVGATTSDTGWVTRNRIIRDLVSGTVVRHENTSLGIIQRYKGEVSEIIEL